MPETSQRVGDPGGRTICLVKRVASEWPGYLLPVIFSQGCCSSVAEHRGMLHQTCLGSIYPDRVQSNRQLHKRSRGGDDRNYPKTVIA